MNEGISFRDSNDGAYTKAEVRTGPPLSYVSEKLGDAMKCTHFLLTTSPEPKTGSVLSNARYAFHYQMVAFLALHNMLAYANEKSAEEHLLSLTMDGFEEWIRNIEANGSITG